jgi:hypothetical protein
MLLTDENAEETGVRFDHLTLAADASFRFEPTARSMMWFQMLEGDAKLKISPFTEIRRAKRALTHF